MGNQSACAVVAGGEVRCWGDNSTGGLGDGTTTNSTTPVAVLQEAGTTHLAGATQVEIIVGGAACALVPPRGIWCWGEGFGRWAVSPIAWPSGAPASLARLTGAVFHYCALGDDGSAWCWGDNTAGELGDGTSTHSANWVRAVPSLGGLVAVAAGYNRTCAVPSDGSVQCWGQGFGLAPTPVSGFASAVDVDVSIDICATSAAGDVHCTGDLGFAIPRAPVPGIP
jgi:alpha-tubulin suppressor-like RCC1 family protein